MPQQQKSWELKAEIKDKIENDPDAANGVIKALGIKPASLHMVLRRNSSRLVEFPVLRFLSEYLNLDIDDLMRETSLETIPG